MKTRIVKLMHQILFDFMKAQQQAFSILSRLSAALHQQENRSISRSSSYDQASSIKWNSADIGFFDPHFNDKTIATTSAMKHSEKNIYFRNIHLFLERCSNIAAIKSDQLVKNNLFICLRKLTLQWYIDEMTSNVKTLIKYASDIKHWFVKLLTRFKKKSNIALFILMKEKYTFENAKNQRKFRKYASIILRAFKSTNLAVSNQIAMIWNDMNVEFQRNIQRSNEDIILNDFLNALNEFKNIWWQFARRRMLAFKNFNYRLNQYQYSKKRTDQYQQFEKKFYNISEHEKYRKNYFRSSSISNFNANYNNRQQYDKFWTQRTSYQSIKQSYQSDQSEKNRQTFTNITNSSKYSKFTNFNKSQHSIYSKFQRYSIDSKQTNSSYQQKTYHEHEKSEQNIENDENQENNQNNFSFNFANLNEEDNEVYYEK